MDRRVLGLGRCLQRPRNRDRLPGHRGFGRTSCFRTGHSHGQEQGRSRRVYIRPIRGGVRSSYLAGATPLNENAEIHGARFPYIDTVAEARPITDQAQPAELIDLAPGSSIARPRGGLPSPRALLRANSPTCRRNPPRAALTGALGRPQLKSLFPRSRLTSSTGDDAIRGPPMQPARSTSSTPRNDGASPRLAAASRPGRTQPEPVSRENAGGSIDEPWTLLPVGPVVEDRILAQQGSELAGAFRVSRRATHRTAISRQVVVPQPHRRPERNVAESSAHSAAQSRTISAVP
ncbi:hypothetical protein Maq22A_2p42645 (plasmid) [Methylobacterium aquaticum]|uniref:Uncharacterized protein n=1 Tax=Methylobacterium aquaticum TaxID=270351 RepID=A0A1Y0Z953_9HYPH|nr:hypothetical protein Maq22A_2p42645 [Methylobacterium aquaticum]